MTVKILFFVYNHEYVNYHNSLEILTSVLNSDFIFTGLWVICFKGFEDPHHWYDTKFNDCWWVFEEEYYIIYDILFKG